MIRRNTPPIVEINLVKGNDPIGVRQRQPSHPLIESRDTEAPEKLLEPERENIYRQLEQHEGRIDSLEIWQREVVAAKSMPVKLDGPGGFSITGNWRFIAGIAFLTALVAVLYIVLRYG
jgi:hypothetical protein